MATHIIRFLTVETGAGVIVGHLATVEQQRNLKELYQRLNEMILDNNHS